MLYKSITEHLSHVYLHAAPTILPLTVVFLPPVAIAAAWQDDANQERYNHAGGCRPSQSQELVAPAATDTDVLAIVVDNVSSFDRDDSHDDAGDSQGERRDASDEQVQQADAQAAQERACGRGEEQRDQQSKDSEASTDAIQHEARVEGVLQRRDALLDLRRPAQLLQCHARVRLVERGLQFLRRVEVAEGRAVAARRHIVLDMAERQR